MFSPRTLVIKAKPRQCSKLIRSFCTSKGFQNYDRATAHFGRSKAFDIMQAGAQDLESDAHRQVDTTINLREQKVTRLDIQQGPTTQKLGCDLLSRDPRWSILPARARPATMAALTSLIVPEVPSFPNADNTFKSLDNQPPLEPSKPCLKRQAIVLDCEMVGVGPKGSISALARLSAIDFLTGELLIDKLVLPLSTVTSWRTEWSGITAASMKAACDSGEVLEDAAAAREMLFRHMDGETVLIGHALYNDLEALKTRHERVVDSASLIEAAVGHSVRTKWGLKRLCKELLGIVIQNDRKNGHDSIEDALATREVVLWCMEYPGILRVWAAKKRGELEAKELEVKTKQELEARRKKELKAKELEAKELEAKELEAKELSAKRKIELAAARLTELAAKIKVGAKDLTGATRSMQHAARKVHQEDERLRMLLARHKVLNTEVDSLLRMCEQTEASSAKPEAMPTLMSKQDAGRADMTRADLQCAQGSKPLLIRKIPGFSGPRRVNGPHRDSMAHRILQRSPSGYRHLIVVRNVP